MTKPNPKSNARLIILIAAALFREHFEQIAFCMICTENEGSFRFSLRVAAKILMHFLNFIVLHGVAQ